MLSVEEASLVGWGMWQHSWLRHYATSQKVAGLNPDEVTGFFSHYDLHTIWLNNAVPISQSFTQS
jgi:hypothetical protein